MISRSEEVSRSRTLSTVMSSATRRSAGVVGKGGGGVGGGGGAVPQQTYSERASEANAETIKQLRHAVQMTTECEQLGTETMESLSRQGESIKRSQTNVDAIEGHNVKGKHLLRGMGSLWGGLSNAMGRAPADVDDTVAAKAARREAVAAAAARAAKPGAGAHLSSGAAWVSDKEILDCTLCRKSFGLLIRKHHCRACGKIICKACSETRVILSGGGGDGVKPERVCDACMLGDGISSNTSSSITSSSSSGNNNTRVVGRGGGTTADESGTKNPSAVFSTTTTTTTSPTMKETEEDSLLAAISLNVGRLGEIGRGMGVELTSQDKALDELTESVERAGLGLKRNTKVATKISKS